MSAEIVIGFLGHPDPVRAYRIYHTESLCLGHTPVSEAYFNQLREERNNMGVVKTGITPAEGQRGGHLYRQRPTEVEMFQLTTEVGWVLVEAFANHLVRYEQKVKHGGEKAQTRYWVYSRKLGQWVEFEEGDWLAYDAEGSLFVVPAEEHKTRYEAVPPKVQLHQHPPGMRARDAGPEAKQEPVSAWDLVND